MSLTVKKDWNPETYERFRDFRLRPAMDLLAQIGPVPDGDIIDLGCGAGVMGAALKHRFSLPVTGVDLSPAMLAKARETGAYQNLVLSDIATWQPDDRPAAIFSNAALHWVADHTVLMPRLAGLLVSGGILAVQMPGQSLAPSHRLLRDVAQTLFPERFSRADWQSGVLDPVDYERLLSPIGQVTVWETTYLQRLNASDIAHPVRLFTESTAAKPILDRLTPDETSAFLTAYEAELEHVYPRHSDGSVAFPFRRLFYVLTV